MSYKKSVLHTILMMGNQFLIVIIWMLVTGDMDQENGAQSHQISWSLLLATFAPFPWILWSIFSESSFRKTLTPGEKTALRLSWILFLGLGLNIFITFIQSLVSHFVPGFEHLQNLLKPDLDKEDPGSVLIAIVFLAPIMEESFFRGVILRGLAKRKKPIRAILFSASLFALVHINPGQVLTAFILGIFLGYIYLKTNSLLLSILAHGFHNSLVVIIPAFAAVMKEAGWLPGYETSYWTYNWIDLLGVGGVLLGSIYLWKEKSLALDDRREPESMVLKPRWTKVAGGMAATFAALSFIPFLGTIFMFFNFFIWIFSLFRTGGTSFLVSIGGTLLTPVLFVFLVFSSYRDERGLMDRVRQSFARQQLTGLVKHIESYRKTHKGKYPQSLKELMESDPGARFVDPYRSLFQQSQGGVYYRLTGKKFKLRALGYDGKAFTDDDVLVSLEQVGYVEGLSVDSYLNLDDH